MALEISDTRVWVKLLTHRCPFDEALIECPMREYRSRPMLERLAAVDRLSQGEVDRIVGRHRTCFAAREG